MDASQIVIATVNERLDSAGAGEFKAEIATLARTAKGIVVDLSKTVFIDSAGLGALVSLLKNCTQQDIRLYLAGLTPQVRQIFELTRLYRLFDIFETTDQARSDLLGQA
ncbi:MAG: STAS domain-containing protein [Lentisphaeria bacterium]